MVDGYRLIRTGIAPPSVVEFSSTGSRRSGNSKFMKRVKNSTTKASAGRPSERRCTGADLIALLSELPRPDDDFFDAVEALCRTQPAIELSPWDKQSIG